MIRWDNDNGALGGKGETRAQSATLVDLYPTLVELCGITGENGTKENFLPEDRVIDGVSMASLLREDAVIHTKEHPILHMKRGGHQGNSIYRPPPPKCVRSTPTTPTKC